LLCVTVAECDDDDNDEDEAENQSNCQEASSSVVCINDSASVSPHAVADQSDEEPEVESTKSKLPKSGLRIKLSLKPVRKSSREHKAPVSICWIQLTFRLLWPPHGIGQAIMFLSCGFFYLLSSIFFSSPILSCCRLDVCHTATHGVALVQI